MFVHLFSLGLRICLVVKTKDPGYGILIFTVLIFLSAELISCSGTHDNNRIKERVDSLEQKLADTYKPGLGEFMTGIQIHHAKLWFAGQNQNWELAGFETGEIKEIVTDIQKYHTDRKESKMIGMLGPALDSLNTAIRKKNLSQFTKGFASLTTTCNSCHIASGYKFNLVKTPETPPFSNQDFNLKNK
jgi:hypothetical protein